METACDLLGQLPQTVDGFHEALGQFGFHGGQDATEVAFDGAISRPSATRSRSASGSTMFWSPAMPWRRTAQRSTLRVKTLPIRCYSPLRGSFGGFPPTMLVSGTRDLILSQTVLLHWKLRQAGVTADLHVMEGASHFTYFIEPFAPESQHIFAKMSPFFDEHLES